MVNKERIINEFMELVKVNSLTFKERKMADLLFSKLEGLGLKPFEDKSHDNFQGEAGNIIARLKGKKEATPLLLCSHMDRVTPGEDINPVIKGNRIESDGTTVLGSDDAAGIVAILEVVRCIKENNLEHGPIEIIFTSAEEGGLFGSKYLNHKELKSEMGYVLDAGGRVGNIANQAPGQNETWITVKGKAAHAGSDVEKGINAIQVASEAISYIDWGRLDEHTTSNLGLIEGGRATNIVCDFVNIKGEVRSKCQENLDFYTLNIGKLFAAVTAKWGAKLDFTWKNIYSPFSLDNDEYVIKLAVRAAWETGVKPVVKSSGGGSDANIFNAVGIPSVNLGIGTQKAHTTEEYIHISELVNLAQLVVNIIKLA